VFPIILTRGIFDKFNIVACVVVSYISPYILSVITNNFTLEIVNEDLYSELPLPSSPEFITEFPVTIVTPPC
jgi:hypothetical protein